MEQLELAIMAIDKAINPKVHVTTPTITPSISISTSAGSPLEDPMLYVSKPIKMSSGDVDATGSGLAMKGDVV